MRVMDESAQGAGTWAVALKGSLWKVHRQLLPLHGAEKWLLHLWA